MSVLRRKAQAGKKEYQVRSMTVPKALRVALAKTADEMFGMAMTVIGATQETSGVSQLTEDLDENDLLVLLDGPNGLVGGAVLGAGLVTALVQQQTTCHVSPFGETRALTETDAALCSSFVDSLLQKAFGLLETDEDRLVLGLYRFGARTENKRLFELALEQPEFHVLRLTVDVAAGTLQAPLVLVLPVQSSVCEEFSEKLEEDAASSPAVTLEQNVLGLKSELSAVLCKISLPLERVSDLCKDDTFVIPTGAFEEVKLLCEGGRKIALGALGQTDGQRAIMILDPMSNDFDERGVEDQAEAELDVQLDVPNLNFNEPGSDMQTTSSDIETVEDLLEVPTMVPTEDDGKANANATLPDLADLPHLTDPLPDLPDLPELGDLPKLNIA